MNGNQEPTQDRPFTKSVIKSHLKRIMKACDEDSERDFLSELGALHRDVVYESKYLTDEQFTEMSHELLEELETERNAD